MSSHPPAVPGELVDDGRGRIFPCEQCGADLQFNIGQQNLKCPFCGAVKEILLDEHAAIQEQDFHAALERLSQQKTPEENSLDGHSAVRCESCGSEVIFEGTLTSTSCPYCGSPIQRENVHRGGLGIPVDALLPFQVEQSKAQQVLSDWIRSRWFAPNDFKRAGVAGKFNGVYLPFWTYDSLTLTRFVGERGEHYTVTVGTGKDQRTETRTHWYPASGQFQRFFDDVIVNATRELPAEHINNLSPWPLESCRPFSQEYLAGFFARTYDIDVDQGFELARLRIEEALREDCTQRIGGDEQRLHDMQCRYDAMTFKHLLLPVWMLAYRYKGESYRVFVNAVTAEVQGDRPYSWVKITSAVIAALAAALAVILALQKS
jgi:predicted RNA-binding Zn-ribbon protein involved in translation (DUF1610 family)